MMPIKPNSELASHKTADYKLPNCKTTGLQGLQSYQGDACCNMRDQKGFHA